MVKYRSSKSNSWVQFPFTLMFLSKNYLIKILNIFIFLLILFFLDFSNKGFFGQKYILLLSIFFSIYWVISIFIFLFKRSLYSSYTSVIQRFWKRSLYLFWILEFFLFFIYIFLVLNCAVEVEWMYDQPQLFKSKYFVGEFFFKNIIILLTIILSIVYLSNNIITNNFSSNQVYLLLVLILLSFVLFNEFAQTYFISLYYSGVKWSYEVETQTWSLITDVEKMRTLTHYTFLLLILKFWHTVFIVVVFLTGYMFALYQKKISQGLLSSNKQNFFFLFFFGFIMYYWVYKFYMNHVYSYIYQWFFFNKFYVNYLSIEDFFIPIKSLL